MGEHNRVQTAAYRQQYFMVKREERFLFYVSQKKILHKEKPPFYVTFVTKVETAIYNNYLK
ncbi:hypothetical protein D770_25425 [Flammeovirgaceae bacterium 311]|nr:hypothetical protein D770_25425 [Flammeovirgaceae bacterium 311]